MEDALVEQPLIDLFKDIGYEYEFGPDIAPGAPRAERTSYREVVLADRLRRSLRRLNPDFTDSSLEEALRTLIGFEHPNADLANKEVYRMLTDGVPVEVKDTTGERRGRKVRVIDFEAPLNNEFLAVNQFSVQGPERIRRPDVVIFVNGLPLALFELKSPTSHQESLRDAYAQINDYKRDIPAIFKFNQVLAVSDLTGARHGTISSNWEWFSAWKGIESEDERHRSTSELELLVRGMFEKQRFTDIIDNFVVFEADSEKDASVWTKKMCKYHQYYGVCRAVENTLRAAATKGNHKIGVFWHTQGSGKSLSMVFYSNKIMRLSALKGPTMVFLTDRNDLDDQLYRTFLRTSYPTAKQAASVRNLKDRLAGAGAEIIFTTIQKFQDENGEFPALTERDNVIVVADEAHRSEYAMLAANVRKAMPNASFMGITGTPVSLDSRDTRLVFGDYVSTYQINRAVEDGATVPIYYEGRLVPLHLANEFIDEEFDDLTGEHEEGIKEHLKRKWAKLEQAVTAEDRLKKIAEDVVTHFKARGVEGKAMVVTISRKAAVEMYKLISKLPGAPEAAVVISKTEDFKGKIQAETDPKALEKRFKDASDPLKLAIVCDMWLTGFDVPPLQTMYLDKPLKNHTLMQAVARVNRVWKDKQGGLIVDYIGVADNLKKALSLYSSDVRKEAMLPLDGLIAKLLEKHDIVRAMLTGVAFADWKKMKEGWPRAELFLAALNEVITDKRTGLPDEEKKRRFLDEARALFKLFALVMPHKEAEDIRVDVEFFRVVYKHIVRSMMFEHEEYELDVDSAVRELVTKSFSAGKVVDIFEMTGKGKPDISILDEKFIAEVRGLKFKNLAIEVMRKLLNDEIKFRMRKNLVRYKSLSELLELIIDQYRNNILDSAKALERLIELAKQIKEQEAEGADLGLSEEETAFYDSLTSGTVIGKEKAVEMAKGLTADIKNHLSVDWFNNEVLKSRIRADIRLMLLRNGYTEDVERMVDALYQQAYSLYKDYNP